MNNYIWLAGAAAALAGVGLLIWVWRRSRRAGRERRALDRLLSRASAARLSQVVVPDGNGGAIHVDQLVLTAQGIAVIELKDIVGRVFASDRMDHWTAIDGNQRYSFANPQAALHDRVAAIRRLVPDVPVEGYIMFGWSARFGDDLPRHVLTPDAFRERFGESLLKGERKEVTAGFREQWETLRRSVEPAA